MTDARRFSTHGLADAERSDRWERWNREALVALACRTPDGTGLRGEEVTLDLPGRTLAHVRTGPHAVERSAAAVARWPTAATVAYVILAGRATFGDASSSRTLRPGDVVVTDADRPFARTFPVPFAELAVKLPHDGARGTRVLTVAGPARTRVRALADHLTAGGTADAATLDRVAADLVDDLTTAERPGDRLALARLLVENHLADPDLSAARLARALAVSERQLSRLFADAGTSLPAYVTARRLARATEALVAAPALPVAAVARRAGFASAAYFSRVFRDRVGTSPSEYRARATTA